MTKAFKVRVIFEKVYIPNPDHYPGANGIDEMMSIDLENLQDDPIPEIENIDPVITIEAVDVDPETLEPEKANTEGG